MHATLRDTRLYFDVDGASLVPDGLTFRERPTALVIHGGPGGDHSSFKPALDPLTQHLQLVYYDHRGQGRSARSDPSRYTLDENAEDLEALRQYLGLGPIVSIGTSYGGMVAMAHAARYPSAVSHLVLCVTAAHHGFIPRARAILAERGTPEQQAIFESLLAGNLKTVPEVENYFAIMAPLYAVTNPPSARRGAPPSPEPMLRAFAPGGFLHTYDLRPELQRITAPTLVISGAHDWICPPELGQEIAALIPNARFELFAHSAHSLRVDEPAHLVQSITSFLNPDARTDCPEEPAPAP